MLLKAFAVALIIISIYFLRVLL